MKRKLMNELLLWKEERDRVDGDRRPLLLHGARQVGKTHLLQSFGESHYKNLVHINFERMPKAASYFDGDISPRALLPILEGLSGVPIVPGETLLFFDEIQSCERALTSLKYFAEDAPEQHVVAAGSLLGVALNREKYSFPVGKVKMLSLYPMDMEEYLWALGEEQLARDIETYYSQNQPMPGVRHQELLGIYVQYLITGGMPSVVLEFSINRSFQRMTHLQDDILNAYMADMTKYATSGESVRIRGSFDSMPAQLSKENKKFQYKWIRKGATANLFGESIDWLVSAGVVLKCGKVEQGRSPLESQKDPSAFKLYMSDVGLFRSKTRLLPEEILAGNFDSNIKGALAENYVAQSLAARSHPLYYWESNSQAEIDFVIRDTSGSIVPVEVKYDDNVRAKSLSVFMKRYQCPYGVRISSRNFGFENGIRSVPLYAAYCL